MLNFHCLYPDMDLLIWISDSCRPIANYTGGFMKPDSGSAWKKLNIFNPKSDTEFSKTSSRKFIPDPGSGFFFHPGSRDQKSTGFGSATLAHPNFSILSLICRNHAVPFSKMLTLTPGSRIRIRNTVAYPTVSILSSICRNHAVPFSKMLTLTPRFRIRNPVSSPTTPFLYYSPCAGTTLYPSWKCWLWHLDPGSGSETLSLLLTLLFYIVLDLQEPRCALLENADLLQVGRLLGDRSVRRRCSHSGQKDWSLRHK